MSPTSYRTAPPRGDRSTLSHGAHPVNRSKRSSRGTLIGLEARRACRHRCASHGGGDDFPPRFRTDHGDGDAAPADPGAGATTSSTGTESAGAFQPGAPRVTVAGYVPVVRPSGFASMTSWPGAVPVAGLTASHAPPSLVATVAVQVTPAGASLVILSVCPGGLVPFSTPRKLTVVGLATRIGDDGGFGGRPGVGVTLAEGVGDDATLAGGPGACAGLPGVGATPAEGAMGGTALAKGAGGGTELAATVGDRLGHGVMAMPFRSCRSR